MDSNELAFDQQIINELLIESFDGLERLDRELLTLEAGTATQETLNVIFRVVHTIKGTSGCIGLSKIEAVAHVGENLLSLLRDGNITADSAMVSTLLEYSDALKAMLHCLEQTGRQGDADYSALLQKLQDFAAGSTPVAPAEPVPTDEELQAAVDAAPPAILNHAVTEQAPQNQTWGIYADDDDATHAANAAAKSAAPAPSARPAVKPAPESDANAHPMASVADSAIRVDVGQLDRLMNLVGELVLARNQIVQCTSQSQEQTFLNASQRLNNITTELQESVMKTRMQPIENVWAKFPRIVRDVAHDLGKQVQLVMEGKSTELDRTIIEAIKDPLTHMIRNAIDHGIETPDERRAAGKPETGTLILRAFHEGGQVIIEIMDDGKGINASRVKQRGIEKGFVTADQAARMSDREAFDLIFQPGFSTAEKITNVSGRGVGMDVVKTNIEKIGGAVDITSDVGVGTTFKIKIPLTLAIIAALVVSSGGERFAIPQVSLMELVRLEGEQAQRGIESLYGSPVYRLRGHLLPLVYLNRELRLGEGAPPSDVVNIVVLQADGRPFGLIVDEVNDTEEIVVKPLSRQLRGIGCFAGATIMGDGTVALILDVLGLARQTNVISEAHDFVNLERQGGEGRRDDRETLLLFEVGDHMPMAIPLSIVSRLEEFPRSSVEHTGDQEVTQYRGQIIPLIRVAEYVGAHGTSRADDDGPLQVVVYSQNGHTVGLVVDAINDIVHESITARRSIQRSGLLGAAVIQKRVTNMLDVTAIVESADPDITSRRAA